MLPTKAMAIRLLSVYPRQVPVGGPSTSVKPTGFPPNWGKRGWALEKHTCKHVQPTEASHHGCKSVTFLAKRAHYDVGPLLEDPLFQVFEHL